MSNWIELNLPYAYYEYAETPKVPDLTERAKKQFGKTPEEVFESLKDLVKCPEDENKEYLWEYKAYKKYEELPCDLSNEALLLHEDKDIRAIVEYFSFKEEYNNWINNQPEMEEYYNLYEEIEKQNKEKMKPLSFTGLRLNKPGVLIEVEEDGKTYQYLIGDINCNRGVCNDCTVFDSNAIVKRYKVVWEPE